VLEIVKSEAIEAPKIKNRKIFTLIGIQLARASPKVRPNCGAGVVFFGGLVGSSGLTGF
jgi:hypothetical protein